MKTVEETTGLTINHYAEIDFAGFLNVVDALGGVTLCNRSGHRLDDSYANLHMDPGCQKMNGVKALAFVRARHVDSDFGRIGRQQEFMRAVMAEVASRGNLAGLPELLDVADIATDHIKTDDALSTSTAIGLARRLRKLDPASLDMRVYPSVASPPRCAGCAAFVDPLPEAAILMRALARDAATLPPVGLPGGKGISLATTPVTVLNGSGVEGAAARAATDLRRLGVKVVGTGNAATPTGQASTLAYPPALARHARLLASVLGRQGQAGQGGRRGQPDPDRRVGVPAPVTPDTMPSGRRGLAGSSGRGSSRSAGAPCPWRRCPRSGSEPPATSGRRRHPAVAPCRSRSGARRRGPLWR